MSYLETILSYGQSFINTLIHKKMNEKLKEEKKEKFFCSNPNCGRELEQWEVEINRENDFAQPLCADCINLEENEQMSKTPYK